MVREGPSLAPLAAEGQARSSRLNMEIETKSRGQSGTASGQKTGNHPVQIDIEWVRRMVSEPRIL